MFLQLCLRATANRCVTLVCHYAFDNMRGKERSIVLCVSPRTSLMVDQKAKFVPRGMSAQFVGEAQCDPQAVESVREGKAQLLFISPESLLSNPSWRDMLRTAVYITQELLHDTIQVQRYRYANKWDTGTVSCASIHIVAHLFDTLRFTSTERIQPAVYKSAS